MTTHESGRRHQQTTLLTEGYAIAQAMMAFWCHSAAAPIEAGVLDSSRSTQAEYSRSGDVGHG